MKATPELLATRALLGDGKPRTVDEILAAVKLTIEPSRAVRSRRYKAALHRSRRGQSNAGKRRTVSLEREVEVGRRLIVLKMLHRLKYRNRAVQVNGRWTLC